MGAEMPVGHGYQAADLVRALPMLVSIWMRPAGSWAVPATRMLRFH